MIRPSLLYAAPVWCGISKTQLNRIQKYQNKCLRLITEKDRYTKIETLHQEANVEPIEEYVKTSSEKFYRSQLNQNKLLKRITKQRIGTQWKHKPLYHRLELFDETASDTDSDCDSERRNSLNTNSDENQRSDTSQTSAFRLRRHNEISEDTDYDTFSDESQSD